jgi:hypothetical protein
MENYLNPLPACDQPIAIEINGRKTVSKAFSMLSGGALTRENTVRCRGVGFECRGATLFPHYIGASFIGFTELYCNFLKEVNAGDTLYPAPEIIDLGKVCEKGAVTTAVPIYNRRNELVRAGQTSTFSSP